MSGGGAAELGVFPAFLWAKHAAWPALERHTRRVKHSALSCLKARETVLAETTAHTARQLPVMSYADFPFILNEIDLNYRKEIQLEFYCSTFNSLGNAARSWLTLATLAGACSYITWTPRRERQQETWWCPVTSFWVSPQVFPLVWGQQRAPDVTLRHFLPDTATPFPSVHDVKWLTVKSVLLIWLLCHSLSARKHNKATKPGRMPGSEGSKSM